MKTNVGVLCSQPKQHLTKVLAASTEPESLPNGYFPAYVEIWSNKRQQVLSTLPPPFMTQCIFVGAGNVVIWTYSSSVMCDVICDVTQRYRTLSPLQTTSHQRTKKLRVSTRRRDEGYTRGYDQNRGKIGVSAVCKTRHVCCTHVCVQNIYPTRTHRTPCLLS